MQPSEFDRLCEAYCMMAQAAHYRPAAPGDGLGGVYLSDEQLADSLILKSESERYARQFIAEENDCRFWIGTSNFSTNRALVFTIEAARLLCGGDDERAAKLLLLAGSEIIGGIEAFEARMMKEI